MALKSITGAIGKKLEGMEPKKRSQVVKGGIVGVALVTFLALYYMSGRNKAPPVAPKQTVATISVGESRLEDDIRASVEKSSEENRNQLKAQGQTIDELRKSTEATQAQLKAMEHLVTAFKSGDPAAGGLDMPEGQPLGDANLPPPPSTPAAWQTPGKSGEAMAPVVEFIGEIGTVEIQAPKATQDNGKKKNPKYYLPVGFMEAKLLTGVSAKTVESAKGDPEPVLLRVQTPAILPNEVRAQLEGCFVVAHGYGSLASERFEARLVSINCLDYSGNSMIEAPIKGIVADKDGQKGITGRPVAKMGANMARLFIAGTVDGAAKALQQSSSVTSISPLGQTQTIDPNQIGRAALGGGVSQGTSELVKIYSELVRQSSPVLEVGPQKEVTIVLTEGAWLEIKSVEDSV